MKGWFMVSGLVLFFLGSWYSSDSFIPPFYPSAYEIGMGSIAMIAGLVIFVYGLFSVNKDPTKNL